MSSARRQRTLQSPVKSFLPERSEAGLAARDIFFEDFNDINFYVEDVDQENLYLEIFRKIFPKLQITKVFPLSGKLNVIAHANDPVNRSRADRSVYIVDKDFDDLLGHVVTNRNVFYLERYCIENFLIDEDAILHIALEAQPKQKRDALKKRLSYKAFYADVITASDPLFRLFFAVQRFNLGLKNCDLKPEEFSQGKKAWLIDPVSVAKYETKVRSRMRELRIYQSDAEFTRFLASAFPAIGFPDTHISGKFILCMSFHFLRDKKILGNSTLDSLCYRLARNGELTTLRALAKRINRFLRSPNLPMSKVSRLQA